jgi:ribosomal protein S18 acetylase RimI-like enzyme
MNQVRFFSDYDLHQLASIFNRAFDGYIGGVPTFDGASFARFLKISAVDLPISQVVVEEDTPKAIGAVARFNTTSRLAGMGVLPQFKQQGVGSWLMEQLIAAARQRQDRKLVLEVIEQNTPAVNLYRKFKFTTLRRLCGFTCEEPPAVQSSTATETDLFSLLQAAAAIASDDLPWQIGLPALVSVNAPDRIYSDQKAFAVISDPARDTIVIRSLFSTSGVQDTDGLQRCLASLLALYPGKKWVASAIFPEDYGLAFQALNFKPSALTQFQMELTL